MNAREELLSTGRLGPVGAELLYETVQLVAVSRRFPPPEGSVMWDADAVASEAHDFVQGDRGVKRLLDVAVRSVDDRSFRRLLEAAVTNHLRDVARRTDMGKLIVRVKEVLRSSPHFRRVSAASGEAWTLADGADELSVVAAPALARAAHGVAVDVPAWSSSTRDAPLADFASFVRLMSAVLAAADGSLDAVEIAHAVAGRLDYRRIPLTVDLDTLGPAGEPATGEVDTSVSVTSSVRAAAIFDGLTDRDRLVVATVDAKVRDLGVLLGTGKSQAAEIRRRAVERVRLELSDDDEPEETVRALSRLCEVWLRSWTGGSGATS